MNRIGTNGILTFFPKQLTQANKTTNLIGRKSFSTRIEDDSSKQKHHHDNHASHQHHHYGGFLGAKHQLQHRVKEKVGMKVVEKTTATLLPRLLGLKKRLGAQLLARKVFRGVAIAIPAVGGLFAVAVSYMDGKRALKEYNANNLRAAGAFTVATVFDVVDAVAHLFTALGLTELIHVHHHSIHIAEELSLAAAIIATGAAIAGEVLTPLAATTVKATIEVKDDKHVEQIHLEKRTYETNDERTTVTTIQSEEAVTSKTNKPQ